MAGGRCQAGYARGALERISTRGGFSGWPHGSLRSTRAGLWVLAAREQSVNDPSDLIQIEGLLHAELRAAPRRALDRDRPAVLLDDPLAEREPEPGPLTGRLCREEGLEDPCPDLRRDS